MTELPPFQTLIDEHAGEVMAVLRGAVGREGAEDCFQETFLAALRAYPSWRRRQPARLAGDDRPSQGDRPPPRQRPAAGPGRRGAPRWRSRTRSPTTAIWAAVGALPPKQRAAVTLRYAGDLPHAEIAAALGCSPEAARRSLHEGLKRLRKEMA